MISVQREQWQSVSKHLNTLKWGRGNRESGTLRKKT